MIETATPETFDAAIAANQLNQLLVVYFWGPECPNCEIFARDLPELVSELPPGTRVLKVNAYDYPELARRYSIAGIPAFVLYKGSTKLGMMRQYHGKEYWKTVVAEQAAGQ